MNPLAELRGDCDAMVEVRTKVRRLLERQSSAHRATPVLIQGETGTGKGLPHKFCIEPVFGRAARSSISAARPSPIR